MLAHFFSLFRRGSGDRRKMSAVSPSRPRLEFLEDRVVPAAPGVGGLPAAGNFSPLDKFFLVSAAQSNEQEIMIGVIAQHNSTNPAVQAFGKQLVTDHTNAMEMEMPLLQQAGLGLPNMTPQQKQEANSLQGLTGTRFDFQFATLMVFEHAQDLFIGFAEQAFGSNADVKAFDAQLTPVLKNHFFTALSIDFSLLSSLVPAPHGPVFLPANPGMSSSG